MFMVKEELHNTLLLTKTKLKAAKKSLFVLSAVAAIIFLANLVPVLISILRNDPFGLVPYNFQDSSISILFGLCIGLLVLALTYRQSNDYYSVFPQTNNSRFVSSLLLNYIVCIFFGVIALVLYLLEYGSLRLLSLWKDGVYFALDFDIGFLIIGLFTFLMYSFIMAATLGLIGAILRKWKLYAAAVFVAIAIFLIVNVVWVSAYMIKALSFLTVEPSIPVFFAKALVIWIVLTALSLVINRYTVYYKSGRKPSSTTLAVMLSIGIAIGVIVPSIFLVSNVSVTSSPHISSSGQIEEDDDYTGFEELSIDVSHLPKGSKITLESETVILPTQQESYAPYPMSVSYTDALDSLQGDTLIIRYQFPSYCIDGFELFDYANPKLTATLDGTSLHLDYQFDSGTVIILPIWGMAGQFERFKDTALLSESPWGYSSGSSIGNVMITVQ